MGNEEKQRKTLLGVLANRFSGQTENIATEALLHIINSSKESKNAFMDFLWQTSYKLKDKLTLKSQAQSEEDDSIPDLVGTNSDGGRLVIVENKFWAGLTENQPNTYVSQLPEGGLLLFVAPSLRLPTVWAEIKRRIVESGKIISNDKSISTDLIEAKTDKITLAVTSWRCLLGFLCTRMTTAGDLDTVSDIKQLIGLCDEQDSDAFIPLKSQDLSPWIPRRVLNYQWLIDRVFEKIAEIKEVKKLRSSGSFDYYAKNFSLRKNGIVIQMNLKRWYQINETPIWMLIQQYENNTWFTPESKEQKNSLSKLEENHTHKVYHENDGAYIPLYMPFNEEKDEVIESLYNQIYLIMSLLP